MALSEKIKERYRRNRERRREEHKELHYDSDDEKGEEDSKWRPPNFANKDSLKEHQKHLCRVKKTGRRPTDCCCFLLFVVFCIGLVACGGVGFWRGEPQRLVMPTDYMGRMCGSDNRHIGGNVIKLPLNEDCRNYDKDLASAARCEERAKAFKTDLTDRPYCWFMDVTNPITYGCTCVSYCPGSRKAAAPGEQEARFCPPEVGQNTTSDGFGLLDAEYCSFVRADSDTLFPPTKQARTISAIFKYRPVLNRCFPIPRMPVNITDIAEKAHLQEIWDISGDFVTRLWTDLVRTWRILIISAFVAVAASFLFLLLIRIFAGVMVWLTIFMCFLGMVGLSAFCVWQGLDQKWQLKELGLDQTIGDVLFGFGIGIGVIAALYVIVVSILFFRIRRAVGVIQEASKAVGMMPQIVMLPLGVTIVYVAFLCYWVTVAVFIWASGTPVIDKFAVRYRLDYWMQFVGYYHILGLFWVSSFLIYFEYAVVAGSVGSWYWRRDKRFILGAPVLRTIGRTIVFHLGTIAFASLIVSIIQLIRVLFERAQQRVSIALKENRIVKGLVWAARIFLFVFEKVVKYINKHSIIQTALYGTNFFVSSRNAFIMIARNPLQLGVIDTIGNVILFIGKAGIAFFTCLISYALTKVPFLLQDGDSSVSLPFLMLAVVFVVSFVIASLFTTVLDTAIDTVLQCFLIDYEICANDPDAKPYCTSGLKRLIQENQAMEKSKRMVLHACCCLTCNMCGFGASPSGRPSPSTQTGMYSTTVVQPDLAEDTAGIDIL